MTEKITKLAVINVPSAYAILTHLIKFGEYHAVKTMKTQNVHRAMVIVRTKKDIFMAFLLSLS